MTDGQKASGSGHNQGTQLSRSFDPKRQLMIVAVTRVIVAIATMDDTAANTIKT